MVKGDNGTGVWGDDSTGPVTAVPVRVLTAPVRGDDGTSAEQGRHWCRGDEGTSAGDDGANNLYRQMCLNIHSSENKTFVTHCNIRAKDPQS